MFHAGGLAKVKNLTTEEKRLLRTEWIGEEMDETMGQIGLIVPSAPSPIYRPSYTLLFLSNKMVAYDQAALDPLPYMSVKLNQLDYDVDQQLRAKAAREGLYFNQDALSMIYQLKGHLEVLEEEDLRHEREKDLTIEKNDLDEENEKNENEKQREQKEIVKLCKLVDHVLEKIEGTCDNDQNDQNDHNHHDQNQTLSLNSAPFTNSLTEQLKQLRKKIKMIDSKLSF